MKTRTLIVLFSAMLPLMAQPPFGRGGRPAAVGPMGQNTAGSARGNRLDFLTGYLSLTETQKTAAQAIFDAANTASATAQGAVASAHDALAAAIKAGTSDNQIDTLAAAVGAAESKEIAIRSKADVKFRALLTAEQKTKLDAAPVGRGRP
jgi:Spy/CpxP family protein refolding chaperone